MKGLDYQVCYLTCRHAYPLTEGVNQASVRIFDDVRRLGSKPTILSYEPVGSSELDNKNVKMV